MESLNKTNKRKCSKRVFMLFFYTSWVLAVPAMGTKAHAQTFAEWFRQNSTQKKYLLQQIAALQVLGGYVRDGYQIAGKGLGSISGYLSSEYTLHTGFYTRLETADPAIRKNPQIDEILNWRSEIGRAFGKVNEHTGLRPQEVQYVATVGNAVNRDCDLQIAQLQQVITDGRLKVNDSERLRLISEIHEAMKDNYRFMMSFLDGVKILIVQRQLENSSLQASRALYFTH
ncbi:hypothetical protein SNE26_20465 [Mucilaginibacter sp. cycad4]|uniref:hypothetical protein n=1 Tax=Mucilaginibacter sp. cycad4 TaxID=3342096 RepID=UPI002AAB904D|nr:hypothetical protein [Mucilaginibacter gossypii]WPU98403.1 hypothetical protein SNE26_20465 [Mucilaginibacter gossypii]